MPPSSRTPRRWDVFICHASEDKPTLVDSLAATLRLFGVEVWYDRFTLRPGDSLRRKVDEGIRESRYGAVVLSPTFFAKDWPQHELDGIVTGEIAGFGGIIPVWHGVGQPEVFAFSPTLADKRAITTSGKNATQIAVEMIEVIRPDLFDRIVERLTFESFRATAPVEQVELRKILIPPIRHAELPAGLLRRIRLIRTALWDVYPHSFDYWVDGFKRDMHPYDEVAIWELIATTYLEFCRERQPTAEHRSQAFRYLMDLSATMEGGKPQGEDQEFLSTAWHSSRPEIDMIEELPDQSGH